MKILKKATAFLLCLTLMAGISGCHSVVTKEGETITLTVYDEGSTFSGILTGWYADQLLKDLNIKLDFKTANDYGFSSYVEQGNLGDLIVFTNEEHYKVARDAGILYNWDSDMYLQTYGTYLSENVSNALDRNRVINSDGGLYGINGDVYSDSTGHAGFDNVFFIRWDLYAELGYPEFNTLEDLEAIMEDMVKLASKDTSKNIYAVSSFTTWDDRMIYLASSTAGMYGYTPFGFGLYNASTDTYEDCLDKDGIYIRCLRFYNALYQKGLVDYDSSSQDYDHARDNYSDGTALIGINSYITASAYNTSENTSSGKYMMPIAGKDFSNICYQNSVYGSNNYTWSISAKCKHPEKALQLINWLFTPTGELTTLYGPQSVNWDYDSNGNPYITEFGYKCLSDSSTEMPDGYTGTYETGLSYFSAPAWNSYTNIKGLDNISYYYLTWQSTIDSDWYSNNYGDYNNVSSDWKTYTGCEDINEYIEGNGYTTVPASKYSPDSIDDSLILHEQEIASSICSHSWSAIYAESDAEFDSIIDEMISDCNSRSFSEIQAFYNQQLDKYKSLMN